MFYHLKELQFNARVSKPDVRFAKLLLEQFGGPNGELKTAMQYFVQAFGYRKSAPDIYDMLMDIATEELSHLEIVGATIRMLLTGPNVSTSLNGNIGGSGNTGGNGELNAADLTDLTRMFEGKAAKENFIHEAMINPHFFVVSSGTPTLTDSVGNPWTATYIMGMGDLTTDLRLNIGAETSAKMVYENLMKFSDDVLVKESLHFLMTREAAHLQMFQAALDKFQSNIPPGNLQSDPRYSKGIFQQVNKYDA